MIALRQIQPCANASRCSSFLAGSGSSWRSGARCGWQVGFAPAPLFRLCAASTTAPTRNGTAVSLVEKPGAVPQAGPDGGPVRRVFRLLDKKEMKELRAFAHQRKKDIVIQHVGKLGITPTVVKNLSDALEAHELIKVRILSNCPEELEEMQAQLEQGTEAQVVEKIGGTVLLYRPSLTKLATAEKRKQRQQRSFRRK